MDTVWKALADPNRRAILDLLSQGPRTTGDICAQFGDLCRTAVMKHLDILVKAELVFVRRKGRHRWNHFNPVPIRRIYERWIGPRMGTLAAMASGIKQHVENNSSNSTETDND